MSGSLSFKGIDALNITSMGGAHYFKIKFWQQNSNQKYYRLKCFDYNTPTIEKGYFYLEPFNTVPNYIYTNYFRILNGQNSTADFDFGSYFSSTNPDRTDTSEVRYVVRLQSATSKTSTNWVTSDEYDALYINLDNSSGGFSPNFSTPTFEDTRSTANIRKITKNVRNGLQGVSNLRTTNLSPATGKYGATIDKYTITIPGAYSRTYTRTGSSDPLPSYIELDLKTYKAIKSSLDVEFKATDSRGFVKTVKKTLTIYPYTAPVFTANNTHRQNGVGQTLILNFTGSWYGNPPLNDGTNPLLACSSIEAKEEGSSSVFSTFVPNLNISDNSFSCNETWVDQNNQAVSFDSSKSYTLTFNFTDGISTSGVTYDPITMVIPVGTPTIAVRKQKVGINKADPTHTLDVTGDIAQNGYTIVGYMGTVGDANSANLNDYTDTGYYFYGANSASISNFPSVSNPNSVCLLEVLSCGENIVQKLYYFVGAKTYIRTHASIGQYSNWVSWKEVTMT